MTNPTGGRTFDCHTPGYVQSQRNSDDAMEKSAIKQLHVNKAINDSMAQVLWTRHFLASQGMHVPNTSI